MAERIAYRLYRRQTNIALFVMALTAISAVWVVARHPNIGILVANAGCIVGLWGIRCANEFRRAREVAIRRAANRMRRRCVLFAVAEVRASESVRDRTARWQSPRNATRWGAN